MSFSEIGFLLEQEGHLARACLCNGLTALRNANLGDKKGLFYSAFFELSNGFERTMKLILILDHMARNNLIPPDSKTIESYGHKLISLFDSTKTVCATHGPNSLHDFHADSLPIKILAFLDRFAHPGGRYANINKLTGHKHHAMADPLVQWGEIANLIFQKHATNRQRQRAKLNGQAAAAAFGDDVTCLSVIWISSPWMLLARTLASPNWTLPPNMQSLHWLHLFPRYTMFLSLFAGRQGWLTHKGHLDWMTCRA